MTRILLIEDDELTRENLQIILEMEGFAVTSAPDGRAGLTLAQQGNPDLILCDVMMPHLDGYEVLQRLRAEPDTAGIPFLFLTSRSERADQRRGMNMGADDYLCKPVDADDLIATVNTRLRRHKENTDAALRNAVTAPDFSSALPLEKLGLTPREAEVLLWVAQGKASADVAIILGMSEKTVKIHLRHIFEKLNVETRTAAARTAIEHLSQAVPRT